MMTLGDILLVKFGSSGYVLQDDGQGPYIKDWHLSDPKPTQVDFDNWVNDPAIQAAYKTQQNAIINAPILAQLQQIDIASIRAIRTKDDTKMQQWESQAAALRAKLAK